MKILYIDSDFKCHINNDGAMTAVETDFFDGKCDTFIEGYRYVPEGQEWTREDGVVFSGVMVAPRKDYSELDTVQREYEREMLAEYETLIDELYSEVTA